MSAGEASFWRVTGLVAQRELVQRGRDRSFAISTAITLGILLLVIVLPKLLGAGGPAEYDVAFTGPEAAAVQARAEQQARTLDVGLTVRPLSPEESEGEALDRLLEEGSLDALAGPEQIRTAEVSPQLAAVLVEAYRQVRAEAALRSAGIDPTAVERARAVPVPQVVERRQEDPRSAERQQVAFVATFLLYGQLLGYGLWVALGVVEEKSSRVVELLLAAVPARALLAGKILGIGLLGLAQLAATAVVGVTAGVLTDQITLSRDTVATVGLVLAWFVLGYSFYASMFAASAARVSRQEELQNVTAPLSLLIIASFLATFYAGNNPYSPTTQVLSVLPPFSALVHPVRSAAGDVPGWQTALAVGLMLVAIAGLVRAAGRLYEGAVLRMGGTVSLRQAWRRT